MKKTTTPKEITRKARGKHNKGTNDSTTNANKKNVIERIVINKPTYTNLSETTLKNANDIFKIKYKPEDIKTANQYISIKKASLHNLKEVSVDIPRGRFTVVTGVSGSGKSSLAFDTLYAEGQRRFVESISSYARQFLERMEKPEVESISGIPPAIAIEQLTPNSNPRSTVGTATEIYDYLKLLYGRIGQTYCESCQKLVRKDTPDSVVQSLSFLPEGAKLYILFQFDPNIKDVTKELKKYFDAGFFRIIMAETNEIVDLGQNPPMKQLTYEDFYVLIDRLVYRTDEDSISRLTESIESAFNKGNGSIIVRQLFGADVFNYKDFHFSAKYECNNCKIAYDEPEPRLFVFGNSLGACPVCEGIGRVKGISENLVIPDQTKTLSEKAIEPFAPSNTLGFSSVDHFLFINSAKAAGIPTDIPYKDISSDDKKRIWDGFGRFEGLNNYFKNLEKSKVNSHTHLMLHKYMGTKTCPSCGGARLTSSARQVYISGVNIPQLIQMPLNKLLETIKNLQLDETQEKIAHFVLIELINRLELLIDIGLEYLHLNRLLHTLSGGEAQRINLSTILGSSLVGTLYVLDEPSIGLHPRDTNRLINILHKLRNIGNTVVVVEHDADIIANADYIIDMGSAAGEHGGTVTFAGTYNQMLKDKNSHTGKYLSGTILPKTRENLKTINFLPQKFITLSYPYEHNLKMDKVTIPIGCVTVVTGVSGSGKTTLVNTVLFKAMQAKIHGRQSYNVKLGEITCDIEFKDVLYVDQSSVTRNARSVVSTYSKVFDEIRTLFARTQTAKQLTWSESYFSFNSSGGRCEACEGSGIQVVEMQFLADVKLVCEVCNGTRYKKEVLEVKYKGKNIVEVLNLSVDGAIVFFSDSPKVTNKLKPLADVGLGYLKLGQSLLHLSGGELQRLKLSTFMDTSSPANNSSTAKQNATANVEGKTLFIFDEPTTGLHFYDIEKLLNCFDALIQNGHTVVIIEHNLTVINYADWVIDLGPEAGENGGLIVGSAPASEIAELDTHTGRSLKIYRQSLEATQL